MSASLLILEDEMSFDIANCWAPGSSRPTKPRVLRNEFGNGYRQRIKDGINNNRRTWRLTVQALSAEEFQELDTFLHSREGVEAFLFRPPAYEGKDPGTLVETQVRVTCEDWNPRYLQGGYVDLRVTFEEDFATT